MSEIQDTLAQVAAEAENYREKPGQVRAQRRAGAPAAAILSVRVTAQQLATLAARAQMAGQPTSAYARNILLDALGMGERDELAAKLETVLRQTLAPELLVPKRELPS